MRIDDDWWGHRHDHVLQVQFEELVNKLYLKSKLVYFQRYWLQTWCSENSHKLMTILHIVIVPPNWQMQNWQICLASFIWSDNSSPIIDVKLKSMPNFDKLWWFLTSRYQSHYICRNYGIGLLIVLNNTYFRATGCRLLTSAMT